MLFDFNEAWARTAAARYDVCICGTGPAGITAARKVAAGGKRVLLLEGGGLSYSEKSQDIYKGRSLGIPDWYLELSRLRYFGGASNHWGGRCGLMRPSTFGQRGWYRLPGWPISRKEVLNGLDEAQDILDIAGKDLAPRENPEFKSSLFQNDAAVTSSPPTNFYKKYNSDLRMSKQIDTFYNANLVGLTLTDDLTQIKSLKVQNYSGQKTEVSATHYILALGGIENSRILLNANRQVPAGIGNHSDMVGRCFMEHLNVPIGRFLVTNTEFWQHGGITLATTDALAQSRNIGHGSVTFDPATHPLSYGRLRMVKQFLRETGCALPAITDVARKFMDFNCPGDGIITSLIEQAPNPDSRVSLTDDVDALGLRRVMLDWRLNDIDQQTVQVLAMEAAQEMARLNYARVKLNPLILDHHLTPKDVQAHAHQMGTTRMSSDPRHGVVDENCRVHGIGNLYIAGSSVFPISGGINPTLTIVLLTLRLANFLTSKD